MLPGGRRLVTLQDAARYLMKLPEESRESSVGKAAGVALIMAAEDRGPLMFAHVGMLRLINRDVAPPTRRGSNALGEEKAEARRVGPAAVADGVVRKLFGSNRGTLALEISS